MIGTTVLLVAKFMAHARFGINALAQSAPRYAFSLPGDPLVEMDQPPTVAIYNDVEHKGITFDGGFTPPEYPAILVFRETRELENAGKPESSRAPEPKQVGLIIAYVTDDKADQLTAQRNAEALLRGAERSLRRYKNQANSDGYRSMNGIQVMDVTRWKRVEETAALDVTKFWGWLEVEVKVVDTVS